MIIGYIDSKDDAQVVELQRQSIMHYAKTNHLSIDVLYDKPLTDLKLDVLSEQKTVLFANVCSLGNTLEKIHLNLEDLYKAKFNSVFIQEGISLPASMDTKKIIEGIGFALCIRNSVSSISTKKALSERSEKGVVLGRRVGSTNKIYKLDKYADFIKKSIEEGVSFSKIAKQINASPTTLQRYVKSHFGLDCDKKEFRGVLANADEKIKSMLGKGKTKTAIAKYFNVTASTLYKKLHQMGIDTNRECVCVKFDDTEFKNLYDEGLSLAKMAKHFNCHVLTIRNHIKQLGLKREKLKGCHRERRSKMFDLKDQIKQLYDEGFPYAEIAKKLNCDDTWICKLVKKWGWSRQRKFKPFLLNEYKSEILELINQNVSNSIIAKQYNVSVVTVRNAIKRWGLNG